MHLTSQSHSRLILEGEIGSYQVPEVEVVLGEVVPDVPIVDVEVVTS